MESQHQYSVFDGFRRLASGPLPEAGLAARQALAAQSPHPVLVIDDATGRNVDLDLEGDDGEVARRLARVAQQLHPANASNAPGDAAAKDREATAPASPAEAAGPRGRGRPKLGVVPKEVTLLPRHWDWLNTQPGGASVTLRRLVEDARRHGAAKDRARMAQERAYYFMLAIAGDLPGYEEATRALFAGDHARLAQQIAGWPEDVRAHALRLAEVESEAIVPPTTA
jgi:hypothetical protein